jgi:hypothetical protein
MIPVSYELGWLKSVAFVSALSLWALVAGHWSSWQAARVEVAQEREARKQREEPLEDKVVGSCLAGVDFLSVRAKRRAGGGAAAPFPPAL